MNFEQASADGIGLTFNERTHTGAEAERREARATAGAVPALMLRRCAGPRFVKVAIARVSGAPRLASNRVAARVAARLKLRKPRVLRVSPSRERSRVRGLVTQEMRVHLVLLVKPGHVAERASDVLGLRRITTRVQVCL